LPPSQRAAAVPAELDRICLHCLEKEPERRYASAAELARELVGALSTVFGPSVTPAPPDHRPQDTKFETVAPASVVSTPAAPVGDAPLFIPGYEILGVIGRGGMGVVYKARQLSLNRIVALKTMREGAATLRVRRLLRVEAEVVAALNHPHVVQ